MTWLGRWQFQHVAVLASGSFGRVVRVQHRLLGKEYVIKRSAAAIVEEGIRRAWCQVCTGDGVQPCAACVTFSAITADVRPQRSARWSPRFPRGRHLV